VVIELLDCEVIAGVGNGRAAMTLGASIAKMRPGRTDGRRGSPLSATRASRGADTDHDEVVRFQ
jgi:hypothetical protein